MALLFLSPIHSLSATALLPGGHSLTKAAGQLQKSKASIIMDNVISSFTYLNVDLEIKMKLKIKELVISNATPTPVDSV